MEESLLAVDPGARLRVYAIWFSMYPTDSRDRWPSDVLADPRVVHWWDEGRAVGRWYARQVGSMRDRLAAGSSGVGGTILWDAYLVYGPDARWVDAPTGLRRWGRTILRARGALQEAVVELMKAEAGS